MRPICVSFTPFYSPGLDSLLFPCACLLVHGANSESNSHSKSWDYVHEITLWPLEETEKKELFTPLILQRNGPVYQSEEIW